MSLHFLKYLDCNYKLEVQRNERKVYIYIFSYHKYALFFSFVSDRETDQLISHARMSFDAHYQ